MDNYHIQEEGRLRQEGKDVRATSREVRRLDLRDTASTLDERGKETDQTVMPNPPEILETWTGEKMRWIRGKRGG